MTTMTSGPANAGQARAAPGGRPRLPMLWITWRQHRAELACGLGLLGCAAAAMIISGPTLRNTAAQIGPRSWPEVARASYSPHYPDIVMQAIPLLIGLLAGVPLASRDIENRTTAFAWTQGTGRVSWLLGKLIPVAALLAAAAIGFGLLFGWWFADYQAAFSRSEASAFPLFAPAMAGWMLAGLTLGVAAGAILRHPAWAMAATVAGWIVLHRVAPFAGPQAASRFWLHQFLALGWLLAVALILTAAACWSISLHRPAAVLRRRRLAPRRDQAAAGPARGRARLRPAARTGTFMPGVIWSQHRRALLTVLTVLGGTALVLLATRPGTAAGLAGAGVPQSGLLWIPLTFPLVSGAVLGAPLVAAELEYGTACFAWTQGVTRSRWISAQLAGLGLALAAGAVAFGLVFQWWAAPFAMPDWAGDPVFGLYAPAFAGWALASFALAAFLGALLRSTAPAATLTILLAAVAEALWTGALFPPATGITIYLRSSRFWPLQLTQAGGLLALAVLLAGATIWLVRSRPGLAAASLDSRTPGRRRTRRLAWLAALIPVIALAGLAPLLPQLALAGPSWPAVLIAVVALSLAVLPLIRRGRAGRQ